MTTGGKIFIGSSIFIIVAVGSFFIFKAVTDNKEREVRDAEKEAFGSLGEMIELGRKKHPKLGQWYDDLSLVGTKAIEDGWAVMTQEQKDFIKNGLKDVPMSTATEEFFTKLGYKK